MLKNDFYKFRNDLLIRQRQKTLLELSKKQVEILVQDLQLTLTKPSDFTEKLQTLKNPTQAKQVLNLLRNRLKDTDQDSYIND